MKKLVITGVLGFGLLGNSIVCAASNVDYSNGKEMVTHFDKETDEPVQVKNANLAWAVGGYVTGKLVDAAGNWVGKQAQKATAQSIYSAAPARKYACYRVSEDPVESEASFGR